MDRATAAWKLHSKLGHPSRDTLTSALDHNVLQDVFLTGRDLTAAYDIYRSCDACVEGKMTAPSEPTSKSAPAPAVGHTLSVDFIFFMTPTIGGNVLAVIGRDECSGYLLKASSKNKKGESVLACLMTFLSFLSTFGHVCARMVFDNEAVFVSVRVALGHEGVEAVYLPSGLHNKRVERAIRHIKECQRSMLGDLPYALPAILHGELLDAAIVSINAMPDTRSGPTISPYQLVTHRRPKVRSHVFGSVGMCYSIRADSPNDRAEWGIFLDDADNATSNHRIYIPLRGQVVSRRKFVESSGPIPTDWKLAPRLTSKVTNPRLTSEMLDPSAPFKPATSTNDNSVSGSTIMNDINAEGDVLPRDIVGESGNSATPRDVSSTMQEGALVVQTPARDNRRATPSDTPLDASDVSTPVAATPRAVQTGPGHRSARIAERRAFSSRIRVMNTDRSVFLRSFASMQDQSAENARLNEVVMIALKMSVRKALNHPDLPTREKCVAAISAELMMLWNVKTFQPVHKRTIASANLSRVYPCHMFIKEKFLANGDFDKIKARLVAGGDWVEPGTVGETSSPTVNSMSVMMILNIAAVMKYEVSTHDVTGAFLVPELIVGERPMYLWLDKELSDVFVKLVPALSPFVQQETGALYFRIMRYLYGLPQASFHFYTHMDATLKRIGFERLLGDPCVYVRGVNSKTRVIIAVHVDDLLAVGMKDARSKFQREIEREYVLTSHVEKNLSYIGLDIVIGRTHISVSQKGYQAEMIDKFMHVIGLYRGPARTPGFPALTSLPPMTLEQDEPLPEDESEEEKKIRETHAKDPNNEGANRKVYLSVVMSLMWLARLTRADILFPTTYLASRSHNPTTACLLAAARILKYLQNSKEQAIFFKGGDEIKGIGLRVYCDASHGTHADGKGHGGIIVTMGSGYVHARSTKVKMITLSSTETEQYVMCEATTYAIWGRAMLRCLGFSSLTSPCKMYQDNMAAIGMTRRNGTFARTKHIMIRKSFTRDAVENGDTKWHFVRTANLMPDMLTKCVPKSTMLRHMESAGMKDLPPTEEEKKD
jgi:hypothetical protein